MTKGQSALREKSSKKIIIYKPCVYLLLSAITADLQENSGKLEDISLFNHEVKKSRMIPPSFISVHLLLTPVLFGKLERAL